MTADGNKSSFILPLLLVFCSYLVVVDLADDTQYVVLHPELVSVINWIFWGQLNVYI